MPTRLLLLALLLAFMTLAPWATVAAAEELSFTNDVLPVLSKHGCNSGQCHGKANGQNGFKLSLYGFDAAADFAAVVHESRGRRVTPAAPDESLLLLKATGAVAHGGGVRFDDEAPHYQLLRRWIAAGTPWGADEEPRATSIVVEPAEFIGDGQTSQSLRVTAHFSDGSTRDVTAVARYDSETPRLLEVDAAGRVTPTGERGEGLVMVRYGDHVGASRMLLPYNQPLPDDDYAGFEPRNFIDELALAKWKKMGIAPSPSASDAQFLRRAYLDLAGILPTPEEAAAFLDDAAADKRERLIDQLLDRQEHADLWTLKWGELLRIKVGDSNYKDNTAEFSQWVRQSVLDNKPYDQFVREILTATGSRTEHPQIDWWRQAINHPVRVEDTSQVFLGLRVSCANCHNHPFENISQDDYWQFAAFFARVDSPSYGEVKEIKLKKEGEVKHPRTGDVMRPKPFGGEAFDYVEGEDPRQKLVDWMTADDNRYFARSIANRVWGHYFNVGLVEPVDDMRATNPASNPELLERLARELIEHDFDLRHLHRLLATSRLYGLASDPTERNQPDTRNFARHYPQRLSPHVLLDAVVTATGAAEKFDGYPDVERAVRLPNEKVRNDFLDVFGRSSRDTPCECETRLDLNLAQVLYLLHSDELQRKIAHKEGVVATLADSGVEPPAAIESLYLRTLSRRPTDEELAAAVGFVAAADKPQTGLEDLLWTLINSNEFLFNH